MAFIRYRSRDEVPAEHDVPDDDHIIRIHGVHPETLRQHYDLYRELMHGPGPLTRLQRELIAVVVSATNGCHY
ncbi:MAG: carboxymuconolactone decarboxylase family protein [Gemmatimonadales bacterium]